MSEVILELTGIKKRFGSVRALKGIDLKVEKGEFITFLGPSGCGKTTTLRIIGGFESPDEGTVKLSGRDVTGLEPNLRNVNTVFQNYALFPHMDVEKNIGYALKIAGMKKSEISRQVDEMLDLVKLPGYGKRMPSQLSGGQRQRVAIARAAVGRPDVLLLDEPLGALDLQLRRQMQTELKRLQKQLGITFVYITHDQEEALNMSDRIIIMNNGGFEQVGTPTEVYDHPRTPFAAKFIGFSNVFSASVISQDSDGMTALRFSGGTVFVKSAKKLVTGEKIILSVRTEQVDYAEKSKYGFTLPGTVYERSYIGGVLRTTITLQDGSELVASEYGRDYAADIGSQVQVFWNPDNAAVLEVEKA